MNAITEREMSYSLNQSGWTQDRKRFELNSYQIDDLISLLNIKEERKRNFALYIQLIISDFCIRCEKYQKRKTENSNKKITSVLNNKIKKIDKLAEKLMHELESFDPDEAEIIFNMHQPGESYIQLLSSITDPLFTLRLHIVAANIKVETSAADGLVRQCLIALIALTEDMTCKTMRRSHDPYKGKDFSVFHKFALKVFSYLNIEIIKWLSINPISMEKAIRNALKEYQTFNHATGRLYKKN